MIQPSRPYSANLFTPSGPYASSKPSPASSSPPSNTSTSPLRTSTVSIAGPAPPNETSQEKVARLRAAAQRAKDARLDPWERVVDRGRVWADRAHRVTTYGLIGFTAIATVITAVAIGDMLVHNRKKRNEWMAEQRINLGRAIAQAREAQANGTASEMQLQLLQEDAEIRAEARAKEEEKKKGIFGKLKEGIFGDLSQEEKKGGRLGVGGGDTTAARAVATAASEVGGSISSGSERTRDIAKDLTERGAQAFNTAKDEGLGIVRAVENEVSKQKSLQKLEVITKESQDVISRATGGGPLDQLADNVARGAKNTTKGWWDWATGR